VQELIANSYSELLADFDDISDEHVKGFHPDISDIEAQLGQNECKKFYF
jgi:hypothetical protein